MEYANIEKLLDIKVTQIQLVRDRGYLIPDEEKEIIKYDENDDFNAFYQYLSSLNDKSTTLNYWKKRGFFNEEAIKFLGEKGMNKWVEKLSAKNYVFVKENEHKLNWQQYWNADYSKSILVYYDTKVNSQIANTTVKSFKNIIDEAEKLYSEIHKTSPYNKIVEGILIVDAKLSPVANNDLKEIARSQVFLESELSYNPSLSIDNQKHTLVPKNEVKALLQSLRADKHGLETLKVYDPTIKYYGWKEGDLIKITRTDHGISILSPDSINYKLVVT